jgi:hypothetical protein
VRECEGESMCVRMTVCVYITMHVEYVSV